MCLNSGSKSTFLDGTKKSPTRLSDTISVCLLIILGCICSGLPGRLCLNLFFWLWTHSNTNITKQKRIILSIFIFKCNRSFGTNVATHFSHSCASERVSVWTDHLTCVHLVTHDTPCPSLTIVLEICFTTIHITITALGQYFIRAKYWTVDHFQL